MTTIKRRINIHIPEHLAPGLLVPFSSKSPSRAELEQYFVALFQWAAQRGIDPAKLNAEITEGSSWLMLALALAGEYFPRFSSTRPSSKAGRPKTTTGFSGAMEDTRWLVQGIAKRLARGKADGYPVGVAKAAKDLQKNLDCPAAFKKLKPSTLAKRYYAARKTITADAPA